MALLPSHCSSWYFLQLQHNKLNKVISSVYHVLYIHTKDHRFCYSSIGLLRLHICTQRNTQDHMLYFSLNHARGKQSLVKALSLQIGVHTDLLAYMENSSATSLGCHSLEKGKVFNSSKVEQNALILIHSRDKTSVSAWQLIVVCCFSSPRLDKLI